MLINGIIEAEFSAGRADHNNPTHITSVPSRAEERHHLDPAQVTEVALEPEETHHVDTARVPSVPLGTEGTHHCVDPEKASTVSLTEAIGHIGSVRGTAVSTEIEDPHHIDHAPVAFVSPSIEEGFRLDPAQVKKQFDRIGRFRILVIGRSNAGKTTLLQRVCNTTELPEIFNAEGKRVKYLLIFDMQSFELLIYCNLQIDLAIVEGSLEAS